MIENYGKSLNLYVTFFGLSSTFDINIFSIMDHNNCIWNYSETLLNQTSKGSDLNLGFKGILLKRGHYIGTTGQVRYRQEFGLEGFYCLSTLPPTSFFPKAVQCVPKVLISFAKFHCFRIGPYLNHKFIPKNMALKWHVKQNSRTLHSTSFSLCKVDNFSCERFTSNSDLSALLVSSVDLLCNSRTCLL